MKSLIKKLLRDGLLNEEFNLDSTNQEDIYNIFKQSYEKSTGASWDVNKFNSRARNWVFFGDETGFVAVRPQRSGLYKLVGVAGKLRGILKGMAELKSNNYPVWGMVSSDMVGMAKKQGFKTPPKYLIKVLLKFIPKSIFGGVDFDVNSDGSITLKYADVGDAKKYFIANDEYFKKLKSDILPTMKDKMSNIPSVIKIGLNKFLSENMLLEDSKELVSEDITSGSVIVYHRTGGESSVEGIASDGYRVGSGAMYGPGVYTTYTLESQLYDKMIRTYGNVIIESKVKSMKNFLIFDYGVAIKIYGNKNYTLDKQLRIILGGKFDKYRNDENLKKLIEKISVVKYTSDVAVTFTNNFKDILSNVAGMVFTGSNDGNVLICYDRGNVEPIRYTTDEGVTWKNILDKNVYQRIKGYDPEESGNTMLSHIANKIQVKGVLNSEEIVYLLDAHKNGNDIALKIFVELTNQMSFNQNDNMVYNLLHNAPEERKLEMINKIFPLVKDKLNNNQVNYLLLYAPKKHKLEMINKIFPLIKDTLNPSLINTFLTHTPEEYREEIVNKIFPLVKDKLDGNIVSLILTHTPEKHKLEMINKILPLVKDKLNGGMVQTLTKHTPEEHKLEMANKILSLFKDKLDFDVVQALVFYIPEEHILEMTNKILSLANGRYEFMFYSDTISMLLNYMSEENKFVFAKQMIPLVKDKFNDQMVNVLLKDIPRKYIPEMINKIFPLVKDKLNVDMVNTILYFTPKEHRLEIINKILPLAKDKLDYNTADFLLSYTPEEHRLEIVNKILLLIKEYIYGWKNKLNTNMINTLLKHIPKKDREEMVNKILPLLTSLPHFQNNINNIQIIRKLIDNVPEERKLEILNKILLLVKDKLNGNIVMEILSSTPEEHRLEMINKIFPLVKDKLDGNMVSIILTYTPGKQRFEMINKIFPLVKDKLDDGIVNTFIRYTGGRKTPKEHRLEIINKILPPLAKDKLDGDMVSILLSSTPEEYKLEMINKIFPLVKDKLDSNMVSAILTYTPKEYRLEMINKIFPLVKDKLDAKISSKLIYLIPEEYKLEMINKIFPLVKDKLDDELVNSMLMIPEEYKLEMINKILPLVKDKMNYDMVDTILRYTAREDRPKVREKILLLVRDKLGSLEQNVSSGIVSALTRNLTGKEDKSELLKAIYTYVPKKK